MGYPGLYDSEQAEPADSSRCWSALPLQVVILKNFWLGGRGVMSNLLRDLRFALRLLS
jgi:hypothetical protein